MFYTLILPTEEQKDNTMHTMFNSLCITMGTKLIYTETTAWCMQGNMLQYVSSLGSDWEAFMHMTVPNTMLKDIL